MKFLILSLLVVSSGLFANNHCVDVDKGDVRIHGRSGYDFNYSDFYFKGSLCSIEGVRVNFNNIAKLCVNSFTNRVTVWTKDGEKFSETGREHKYYEIDGGMNAIVMDDALYCEIAVRATKYNGEMLISTVKSYEY